MNLLAIETSTEQLGVALVTDRGVSASYAVLAERVHAVELPAAVTRVLGAGGLALKDVDGFIVDIGPGSFTGLRIGVAFVKALAFTHKKPVIGVPSLDVLAAQLPHAQPLVCPILDAKQKKVYAAVYRTADGGLKKQTDFLLLSVEELARLLRTEAVLFLGSGVAPYRESLTGSLGSRAQFAAPDLWWPGAATLGRLGLERLAAGLKDDPSTLVPMYLYPRDCTIRPEVKAAVSAG